MFVAPAVEKIATETANGLGVLDAGSTPADRLCVETCVRRVARTDRFQLGANAMRSVSARRGFSLVELIVVVVIIGILAAIAIPRFSRGAAGAGDSGIKGNLAVLRNAIELYYYEHNKYPGQVTDGTNAAGSEAAMIAQLTRYTSDAGVANATQSSTYRFGPYLRTGIPACPVTPRLGLKGVNMVSGATVPAYTAGATTAGWIYNYETGQICVNSNEVGEGGTTYDTY